MELREELFIYMYSVLYKTELDIAILIAAINFQCEVNYLGKHINEKMCILSTCICNCRYKFAFFFSDIGYDCLQKSFKFGPNQE